MKQYLEFGKHIIENGYDMPDRTGTGRRSVFGGEMRFPLREGYPLVTTKKVFTRGIFEELLWILSGDTNNETLAQKNVHIWSGWALPETTYVTDERSRRMSRNVSVTCSTFHHPDGTYSTRYKDGVEHRLTLEEHTRIVRLESDEEAHAEYDKYAVNDCKYVVDTKGDLGPVYGKQWRSWDTGNGKTIDQIAELIENLKNNPYSRRHVITAWNPTDLPNEKISPQDNVRQGKMALAACHCLFQFFVRPLTLLERAKLYTKDGYIKLPTVWKGANEEHMSDEEAWINAVTVECATGFLDANLIPTKELSCRLDQRSADFPLGVPFNIASYALLTMMVAHCTDMAVGDFVHQFGDAHIYANQIETFKKQLEREPRKLPTLLINPAKKDIFSFTIDDFKLVGYEPDEALSFPVAI